MGRFIHWPIVWNEKVVVRNSAMKKVEIATMFAPHLAKPASKPSASTVPSNPPAGRAPRTSGKLTSVISADTDVTSIVQPTTLVMGASSCWLRNQRRATKIMPIGNRNAAKPQS